MSRKFMYEIRFHKLYEDNSISEPIQVIKRRLKLPPPKDATTYGKPVKIRRQKGWTVVELEDGEIIFYRKMGAGRYPNLFERFWASKDVTEYEL